MKHLKFFPQIVVAGILVSFSVLAEEFECNGGRIEGYRIEYRNGEFQSMPDGTSFGPTIYKIDSPKTGDVTIIGLDQRGREKKFHGDVVKRYKGNLTVAYVWVDTPQFDTIYPEHGIGFSTIHKDGGFLGQSLPVATTWLLRCKRI